MELWVIFELLIYTIIGLAVTILYLTNRPANMYMRSRWIMLSIIVGAYILIRLSIWGLMSLESFYQKITLATKIKRVSRWVWRTAFAEM